MQIERLKQPFGLLVCAGNTGDQYG